MNFTYAIWIKILAVIMAGVLLFSCTTKTVETTVAGKLISAKTYKHPNKESYREELKFCKKTVPKDQVDNCMSKKEWKVIVKRFD